MLMGCWRVYVGLISLVLVFVPRDGRRRLPLYDSDVFSHLRSLTTTNFSGQIIECPNS